MPSAVPHRMRASWKLVVATALLALAVIIPASANAKTGIQKATSAYYQLGQNAPISGIKIYGRPSTSSVFVAVRASHGILAIPTAKTTGLTLSYGYTAFAGQDFSFTGTAAAANTALAAMTTQQPNRPYVSTPGDTSLDVNVTVTVFDAVAGLTYNPANQHFYSYVPGKITGTNAFAAAAATTTLGQTGYLASITDSAENTFVAEKIQGDAGQPAKNVWIGASDSAQEGKWVWNGGPDNGWQFWQGCNVANGGGPFEGRFSAWAPSEPNNWNASLCEAENSATLGEDCAIINKYSPTSTPPDNAFFQGQWNDLPCSYGTATNHIVSGYIAEFGNKATGGDYSGVDIVTSTLKARPNTNPKVVKPNFFQKVFSLLFTSKKAKLLPKKPKRPATFTFTTKLRVQTAGTYIVTIKRPNGQGSPFQFQPDSSYTVSKKVTYKTSTWKMIITTKKDNQIVTVNPVLKTQNWIKPKDTKLFWQLKPQPAAINQICWVGWCQGTSIPVPPKS